MKDLIVIDKSVPQWKGSLHVHTGRSHDSVAPYMEVFAELRQRGYHFCVVSDHEIYWDSTEGDREDFLALAGVETMLKANPVREWNVDTRRKVMHLQILKDETRQVARPFRHDERIPRCYDQGLDSMNEYIRYLVEERGQIVQLNHPDWSHVEPEILLGTQNIFAFELFNSASDLYCGGQTDDWRWDYCLERGRKLRATAGDDSHTYGDRAVECGASFTMVSTADFSRPGLIRALKEGRFYPSTGPRIYDMRIEDGVLKLDFSDARLVTVVGYGNAPGEYNGSRGESFPAPRQGTLRHVEWRVNGKLNYFRVRVVGPDGSVAWSQPVFLDEVTEHPPLEQRGENDWSFPRYLDEIKGGK
ncbi:MAG: hypothetical protein IJU18_00755 [Oscillospiraceae bacterium]|nr:hypothetical protein [Oscillospiraceae bacterium]